MGIFMLNQTRFIPLRQFVQGLLFSIVVLLPLSTIAQSGKTYTNSIGMEFIQIPAGEFMMGCGSEDEPCLMHEKPQHRVIISQPFYLGKYEVTQGEWLAVMGNNPSYFKGKNNPVESVSWNDIQVFIQSLNEKEGANRYRLPTEAEWEYAARAGTSSAFSFGNEAKHESMDSHATQYAWYGGEIISGPYSVGQKRPNPWGLYDMHGNVAEWVEDWFDENYYARSPAVDPTGSSEGMGRVLRGGCWCCNIKSSLRTTRDVSTDQMRSAFRVAAPPDKKDVTVGFRLARSLVIPELASAPETDTVAQAARIKMIPSAAIMDGLIRNFSIPEPMFLQEPELVRLLLQAEKMEDDEKQSWFDIYPSMDAEQIARLYSVLNEEKERRETAARQREAWDTALTLSKTGRALYSLENFPAAFAAYSELVDTLGNISDPDAREWEAAAVFQKGFIRHKQKQFAEAVALYDQVDQRFAQDGDPRIRRTVADALNRKAFLLSEYLNDPSGALKANERIQERYCAGQNQDGEWEDTCFDAKQDSIEPLILLGRQAEASARIREIAQQPPKGYRHLAELSFLLWLGEPGQHTTQDVLKAIRKNSSDGQKANWIFNSMRPFMEREPEPRKSQARCFAAFFEKHHDIKKTEDCLRDIPK
jgi:formylglycine-generating enzyme required for sulfatase activity